jgi:hypothetical protein
MSTRRCPKKNIKTVCYKLICIFLQKDKDEEFEADDDDSDIEETIEEQEKQEAGDYNEEMDDLKNEGKQNS